MHPLARLQYRGLAEEDRKAFLFENVTDVKGRKYDMPVAIASYAGTTDIYALGMQCKREEIYGKWTNAQAHPIEPVTVSSGPCQERTIDGTELKQTGLDWLPVPISTPGFDNGPYTTSSHFVTRDPETGQYNMGNYRGQIKATDRMGCFAGNFSGLRAHWNKCRTLKRPLEVACVIGVAPHLSYAAVARIAPGLNEFAVAGGISGEPVELIPCKSIWKQLELPPLRSKRRGTATSSVTGPTEIAKRPSWRSRANISRSASARSKSERSWIDSVEYAFLR